MSCTTPEYLSVLTAKIYIQCGNVECSSIYRGLHTILKKKNNKNIVQSTKPRTSESCPRRSVAVCVPWRCTVLDTAPDSRRFFVVVCFGLFAVVFFSFFFFFFFLCVCVCVCFGGYPDSGFMATFTCPRTSVHLFQIRNM